MSQLQLELCNMALRLQHRCSIIGCCLTASALRISVTIRLRSIAHVSKALIQTLLHLCRRALPPLGTHYECLIFFLCTYTECWCKCLFAARITYIPCPSSLSSMQVAVCTACMEHAIPCRAPCVAKHTIPPPACSTRPDCASPTQVWLQPDRRSWVFWIALQASAADVCNQESSVNQCPVLGRKSQEQISLPRARVKCCLGHAKSQMDSQLQCHDMGHVRSNKPRIAIHTSVLIALLAH